MKKLLIVAALVAVVSTPLRAEDPSRLYSTPSAPPREVLDRLRLKLGWTATVPMDGRRDGLFSVQLLPGDKGQELIVQTRSGGIYSYDAATGRQRWATHVGVPYRVAKPVGYNTNSIFVINNIDLISLDRATGGLKWEFDLPSGAASPPVADDDQVYLSLTNGRFATFMLPNFLAREAKAKAFGSPPSKLEAARSTKGIDVAAIGPLGGAIQAYRVPRPGPQPVERGSFPEDEAVEQAAVVSSDCLLFAGTGGEVSGLLRLTGAPAWKPFLTRGRINVPVGQHEDTAYVASSDSNLYAVSINTGRVFWRVAGGGLPTERPAVLDEDVYVGMDRTGLVRLGRAEGDARWRNGDASRFLAANRKFVYAADHNGRLIVIDRERGTTLSAYDGTRDFAYPVQNDLTDRIYLAANNGMIVCLHERDSLTPQMMRTIKERAPLPPPGGAKPAVVEPKEKDETPKPAEPPKPKDKAKDKGNAPEKP
jgi:hypothetical protein